MELNSLPAQVVAGTATKEDMDEILPYLTEFCSIFDYNAEEITGSKFYILKPNAKNPYKQLYTAN